MSDPSAPPDFSRISLVLLLKVKSRWSGYYHVSYHSSELCDL